MTPTPSDPSPFEEDLLRELRTERPAEDGARERVATRLGFAAVAPEVARDTGAVEHGGASAVSNVASLSAIRALGLASLTFALGAAAGVTGQAWLSAPEVKIVYLERPAQRTVSVNDAASSHREPESVTSSAPPVAALASPAKVPVAASAASAASATNAASSGRQELGPEVTMLDQARKALSERNYARAFELLASHARLFPTSVLEQEREALQIKALVATGRVRKLGRERNDSEVAFRRACSSTPSRKQSRRFRDGSGSPYQFQSEGWTRGGRHESEFSRQRCVTLIALCGLLRRELGPRRNGGRGVGAGRSSRSIGAGWSRVIGSRFRWVRGKRREAPRVQVVRGALFASRRRRALSPYRVATGVARFRGV